jgi:AcrR family transcriptional regulator
VGAAQPNTVDRLYDQLPPRPAPELDKALDALERCLSRFGIRRTSMTDVAKELGVARTTLYRQVSSIEEAMALLSSRRFHRYLDEMVLLVQQSGSISPETFVQATARAVRLGFDDPVGQRVLRDEPDLIGSFLTSGALPVLAEQIIDAITPIMEAAMATGLVRPGQPRLAATWMVRIVLSLAAVPASDDELEDAVRYVLLPMLDPAGSSRG